MIGYDTNITNTIRQLRSQIIHPHHNNNLSSECRGSLSSALDDSDPIYSNILLGPRLRTTPSLISGNPTDQETNLSKSSAIISQREISYPPTILNMTASDGTDNFSITTNPPDRTID